MVTITSAEFQKNFGRYKEAAQREPIRVTSHGRESLVVLSAEEYRRLAALDARRAHHPADLPPELLGALEEARAPADATHFDTECRRQAAVVAAADRADGELMDALDAAVLDLDDEA